LTYLLLVHAGLPITDQRFPVIYELDSWTSPASTRSFSANWQELKFEINA
jgi:hypothetical protein